MLLAFSDMLGGTAWGDHALMWLLDVSLKATLLLLVAALVLRSTRGRSPGLGFSAVSAALVGALMLPALAMVMPRYNVPLLPLPIALNQTEFTQQDYPPQQRAGNEDESIASAVIVEAAAQEKTICTANEQTATSMQLVPTDTAGNSQAFATSIANPQELSTPVPANSKISGTSKTNKTVNTLGPAIFILWVAGAAAGFIWLSLALLRLRQWTAAGRELSTEELGYDADWLRERIGVRCSVRLLESDGVSSPMTYGWRQPVVLLPTTWRGWSRHQMRIVLLHEFMHVRRGDWAYLLMARVACALHWYNPLVWLAARWLEDQRELACDDDVVRCGARPTAYAETLVQMAARMAEPRWGMALSVNMAARPRLENRVVSILRASKRRRAVMTIPMIIGLSGVVGFLSIIEPWFQQSPKRLQSSGRDVGAGRIGGRGEVDLQIDDTSEPLDLSQRIRNWQLREHSSERASSYAQVDERQSRTAETTILAQSAWIAPEDSTGQYAMQQMQIEAVDDERVLRWQQALAGFEDVDTAVRHAVLDGEFVVAERDARAAVESIRAARQFAPTVTVYEQAQRRAADLIQFVTDEATHRSEAILTDIQVRIDKQDRADAAQRQQELRAHGRRLLNHAVELSRLGQVEEALVVLERVTQLLPDFQEAHDLRTALTSVYERRAASQRQQVDDSYDVALTTGSDAGPTTHSHRSIRDRLVAKASSVRFDGETFKSALDQLRDEMDINLVVDWHELELVGITQDALVSLHLADVPYERVLSHLLKQAGDGVDLGYRIDRSVLEISTVDALSRAAFVKVYDIGDVITTIPNFLGPQIDWTQVGQSKAGAGGLAGGRYLEGNGLGGANEGGIIRDDTADADDREHDETTASLIELIRATIEPESWRSAGGNVGGISTVNHQLVVTQTSAAHGQLEDL